MVINEGSDQRFVEELKGIIEENIDDTTFSTEQLCRTIGLSRSQLYRKVKAATSLSLSLFIRAGASTTSANAPQYDEPHYC